MEHISQGTISLLVQAYTPSGKGRRLGSTVDLQDEVLSKDCPNSCSNHGECLYYDSAETLLSHCSPTTFTCQARCNCFPDYFGRDCSKAVVDKLSILALRGNLCEQMFSTKGKADITSSLIVERAGKVIDALLDPTQLTQSGFLNCTLYFLDTLQPSVGINYYTLAVGSIPVKDSVFTALSVILQGYAYNYIPPSIMTRITSMISALAYHRQQILAVGEKDTPFIDSTGLFLVFPPSLFFFLFFSLSRYICHSIYQSITHFF